VRSLYIAATEESAGKTTLAVGLCLALRERGIDAGYFKPVGAAGDADSAGPDTDAAFVADVLGLDDDPLDLCPLALSENTVATRPEAVDAAPLVVARTAFDRVAAGHDLLVCEGLGELWQGRFLEVSGADVASALELPTLIVARFAGTRQLDDICYVQDSLRERLLGVVFTKVPQTRIDAVQTDYAAFLERNGISVYGVIPANERLAAVPVGVIAAELGGRVICGEDAADELAETYLIGAMSPEHALAYFERTPNKVVVVGGDRDDLMMAALQTSTAALVLTGTFEPGAEVIERATAQGVAVISVPDDTVVAADGLRRLFGRISVHEQSKIDLVERLVADSVEVGQLLDDLA